MAHPQQAEFCKSVKKRFPHLFENTSVLDIGSLDINGNNRYLFNNSQYIGIDVGDGKNVDYVCRGHEFKPNKQYGVVISTECFEHDQHWRETIMNCIHLTKSGGIFLFTCATTGRNEHGTSRTTPQDAPLSHGIFNDYYMNLTEEDICSIPYFLNNWDVMEFSTNKYTKDLYFFGIKK